MRGEGRERMKRRKEMGGESRERMKRRKRMERNGLGGNLS